MTKAGWCIYYTGLLGRIGENEDERRCKAGMLYADVKGRKETGGVSVPCVPNLDAGLTTCPLYAPRSEEQAAEEMRREMEHMTTHFAVVAAGYCPHCGKPMRQEQIGRCVYAKPCGHRLNEIAHDIKGTEHLPVTRA
jgi:hypothetical protein